MKLTNQDVILVTGGASGLGPRPCGPGWPPERRC